VTPTPRHSDPEIGVNTLGEDWTSSELCARRLRLGQELTCGVDSYSIMPYYIVLAVGGFKVVIS
jgi:hypothetical protein